MNLNENVKKVLDKRCLSKDAKGNVIETTLQMFWCITKFIASVQRFYDDKVGTDKTEKEFYDMMANLEFMPNSPTLMNSNRCLGQLSACFVLPPYVTMGVIDDNFKKHSKF